MKYLMWLIGVLSTIIVVLYILLFTSFGNSLVGPKVESTIKNETKLDSKLKVFSLTMSEFEFLLELNKNNTIHIQGEYSLFSQSLDVKYMIMLEELKSLKSLIGEELDTSLHLNGTILGDTTLLTVKGKSDFATSNTNFKAELIEFNLSSISLSIKGLKIQEALTISKQPHYMNGYLNLNVDIKDTRQDSLDGLIESKIYKGVLDSDYLSKTYEFKSKMPRVAFNMNTITKLQNNSLLTSVDFNSNIANLDIKKASVNIKEKSLRSDYVIKIHDLDKLYFLSQRHLKGSLSAKGNITKAKDIDLTIHSNVAGGKLIANLHNDDFKATVTSMQTLEILEMLIYPKVFRSSISGVVDYNIASQKGLFKGSLKNGKFTKNSVLDIAKDYAHTDMYKENFSGNLDAKINQENILASLNLKSNSSSVVAKNTKLNSKTNIIDSKVEINANGNPLEVTLKGNVKSPKVGVNADELIKREGKKVIEKEVNKFLKGFF